MRWMSLGGTPMILPMVLGFMKNLQKLDVKIGNLFLPLPISRVATVRVATVLLIREVQPQAAAVPDDLGLLLELQLVVPDGFVGLGVLVGPAVAPLLQGQLSRPAGLAECLHSPRLGVHRGVAVPDHGGEPGLLGGDLERLGGVVAAGRLETDLRIVIRAECQDNKLKEQGNKLKEQGF